MGRKKEIMLKFRPITLQDRDALASFLYHADGYGAEASFVTLFLWGDQKLAFFEGEPVILSKFSSESYAFPARNRDLKAVVEAFLADARERGFPCRIFGLLERDIARMESLFPGRFRYRPVRNSFDYIYEIDHLADLHGKKLQAKRNHCNRFEEEHPDYRVLPLDASVLPRCREFTEKWYDVHIENGSESDFSGERIAIAKAFDNFDALGMEGIALETDGKLVAFSMGNRIREDTYDVNFEKAMAQVNGAYPMINREFARLIRQRYPEIRYLNREDDMGIAGLRRAKESYTPDILLEKYLAEEAEA